MSKLFVSKCSTSRTTFVLRDIHDAVFACVISYTLGLSPRDEFRDSTCYEHPVIYVIEKYRKQCDCAPRGCGRHFHCFHNILPRSRRPSIRNNNKNAGAAIILTRKEGDACRGENVKPIATVLVHFYREGERGVLQGFQLGRYTFVEILQEFNCTIQNVTYQVVPFLGSARLCSVTFIRTCVYVIRKGAGFFKLRA